MICVTWFDTKHGIQHKEYTKLDDAIEYASLLELVPNVRNITISEVLSDGTKVIVSDNRG